MATNTTSVTDPNNNKRDNPNSVVNIVNQTLKRFSDYNSMQGECTLYPSIKELVTSLVLPHEGVEQLPGPRPMPGPQFVGMPPGHPQGPQGIMSMNPMAQPQV